MRSVILLAGIAASLGVHAESQTYRFDRVHSQIHASVSHLGLSNSTARFHIQDGSFDFDPENIAASRVDVTIDANSIDLGNATWKDHLSGEKWFDLANHGQMRFVSTSVEPTGEATMAVHGELTLKGETRPVTLDVTLNGAKPHPFSQRPAAGFSATARFNRSDFGISEYVPMVGDEVTLRIEIEASVPAAE